MTWEVGDIMYTSFYISENRIDDLKLFIRTKLKTARFKANPLKIGAEYNVSLELSVEDCNNLNVIREEWIVDDTPVEIKSSSIWDKVKAIFR
jgi:hypothetical protein